MKLFVAATAAALLLLAVGSCPAATLPVVRWQNRDYHRLTDWARIHDLRVTRPSNSREVVVTGGSTRLELVVDGSRIEFNNVALWLSFPVTAGDGQVLVSTRDVRGVLDPLVRPPRLVGGRKIRTICLDAGHGGKDPGQRSSGRMEKQFTLSLAEEVRARLISAGFKVVMTRRSDVYVDHAERTAIAKRANADLFISLHYNASASGGPEASGVEVYAMTPEGARSTNASADVGSLRAWAGNETDLENLSLAYQIQRSLLRGLPGTEDRGVRRARFLVLRLAEMPAVLVEAGFMSNPSDARWIYSLAGRRRMAQSIVDGIRNYRDVVERAAPPASSQRTTSSKSSRSTTVPGSARN